MYALGQFVRRFHRVYTRNQTSPVSVFGMMRLLGAIPAP